MRDGSKPAWTDADMGVIADTMDVPADEVAEMVGRSAKAVRHKRAQILAGWTPRREAWSEGDLDFLRSTPHLSAAEVGRQIGRTEAAVAKRRTILTANEGLSFYDRSDPFCIARRPLVAKTCTGCGLLLDASWFGRNCRGGWPTQCIRCRVDPAQAKAAAARWEAKNERSREAVERLQSITTERATRNGEPWLEADMATLADPDLTNFEKAIRLGRTYKATVTAVSKNGFASKVGRGDPAQVQWIIRGGYSEAS